MRNRRQRDRHPLPRELRARLGLRYATCVASPVIA
jgi:hypothetical protein